MAQTGSWLGLASGSDQLAARFGLQLGIGLVARIGSWLGRLVARIGSWLGFASARIGSRVEAGLAEWARVEELSSLRDAVCTVEYLPIFSRIRNTYTFSTNAVRAGRQRSGTACVPVPAPREACV